MAKRVMKYNPAFLTDEELLASFVVRHTDFELILQVIRENVIQANQHILVVGSRGIGKTTLVLRVVAEIKQNKGLNERWYPLVFSEESYAVSTPGEFWLEGLFHLAHKTDNDLLHRAFEELSKEQDEERLRERALAHLLDFADTQNKRILLVVENFNMLVGDQINDDDAWVLRHTLLNEPRLMLLATATNRHGQTENSGKALFEIFKVQELKPLDENECQEMWKSQTGQDLGRQRIRPIQILTGGNPRLLTILATFGKQLSLRQLMNDLMQLVDDHTDYFKSHLDGLPAMERKVYIALTERWDPSTANEIAQNTRLDVNKTSSFLNRLVGRGAVAVAERKGRTKRYQVAERMYNIYYLMRRHGAPARRVRAVVNFMISFYEPEQLVSIAERLALEACELEPSAREFHYSVYEGIVGGIHDPLVCNAILNKTPSNFFEAENTPDFIRNLKNTPKQEKTFSQTTPRIRKNLSQISAFLKEADALSEQPERSDEAERLYRKVIAADKTNTHAWAKLGRLLHTKPGRSQEAESAYRKALEIDPKFDLVWVQLGQLLAERPERYPEAESAYRKAIEIDPKFMWAWAELGQLLHERLERYQEAESAYRKALEIEPKCVFVWIQLGQLLDERLDRYQEAESAYRNAIESDSEIALPWAHLGRLLQTRMKRYQEAESAFRKAIEIDPKYMWAWAQLGQLLHLRLERYQEAESAYRKAIEINPENAWPWAHLGQLLYEWQERYQEAEAALRKALEISPKYVWAWVQLGQLLHERLERYQEAEAAYRKAIEIDSKNKWAWTHLGQLLHERQGRYQEAEQVYLRIIKILPGFSRPWMGLFKLQKLLAKPKDLISLAQECIAQDPGNAKLLNELAWIFYSNSERPMLPITAQWAREAVRLTPDDCSCRHTLAAILTTMGETKEALDHAVKSLLDPGCAQKHLSEWIDLFVNLAAAGCGKEVIEVITKSNSAELLEPLVVGLRLFLDEDVNVAAEILEVGKDLRKRIEARRAMSKEK